MVSNLARRIGALETGNGTIGISDMLDAIDNITCPWADIRLESPQTWPVAWRGKTIDPRLLQALDGLEPSVDTLTTAEMEARLLRVQPNLTVGGA